MGEFVVPPSAVSCARAILLERFDGVPVASKTPKPIPDRLITIRRAGGEQSWAVDSPLLILQFWAPTEPDAEQMALRGDAALRAAQGGRFGGAFVSGWGNASGQRDTAIVYFPDPDTNRDRYQLTGLLSISKAAA